MHAALSNFQSNGAIGLETGIFRTSAESTAGHLHGKLPIFTPLLSMYIAAPMGLRSCQFEAQLSHRLDECLVYQFCSAKLHSLLGCFGKCFVPLPFLLPHEIPLSGELKPSFPR